MSVSWQAAFYGAAIICFLLAAFGLPRATRPVLLGWVGAALAIGPSFFAAMKAV